MIGVAWFGWITLFDAERQEKRMKSNNLTKIASLPGSGAGCMSSLPAETNQVLSQKADGWGGITPNPVKVQMKAPYFDWIREFPIQPPTIEELGKKYLAAHEGLGC